MSKRDRSFPVKRALLAITISTGCALLLMPAVTLVPRLLFWGGPFGPLFALFIAPLIGLWAGIFIAPISVLLGLAALSSMVFGLTRLGRTMPVARRRWVWALCGLAGGAAAGTALAFELILFDIPFPGTAISGGITGILSALISRRIMRL